VPTGLPILQRALIFNGYDFIVSDMLSLSAHLPIVEVDAGASVVSEGSESSSIWILMSGSLQVFKGDVSVNTVTVPGAIIGEVSLLLGSAHGATVTAMEPSRFRFAADGNALIFSDPRITRLIAVGLAERLNFLTAYLADLKDQYGETAGLSMVAEVLSELAHRQAPPAQPGSARDPNPDY
jgi:CRP/FNR family cyclic AMP-dependent transcriptional regulator